ncbi:MAG: SGNH/GDSL hydrolase family protein [Burkholderiaceae bacterium]
MTFTFKRLLAATLAGAALLAGCGGGEQVVKFAPTRVLAFGDETSVLEDPTGSANGRKYTVNALAADGVTLECAANPIWIQTIASGFGLVFPECNHGTAVVASPASRIYAVPGARVADVETQINGHLLASSFSATDLVVVLAGANDVLALYAQYPGVSEDNLIAQAEAAGTALGLQINRLADAGAKVIVSTVPDFGLSPLGLAEEARVPGRAALLTRLSARLNAKLRVTVVNDGRRIGLVFADESLQIAYKFASGSGFANVTGHACDPARAPSVKLCTTSTLVTDGSATTWLWADDTHLSAGGQALLGSIGLSRAVNNPF